MAAPTISNLPPAPNRQTDSPSEFSTKADSFAGALPTFRGEANTVAQFCNDAAEAVSGIGAAFFKTVDLGSTGDSDPGAGNLRFDNATARDATELYVDDDAVGGYSIRDQIAKAGDGGAGQTVKADLTIRLRDDATKVLYFEVTGISAKSGYTAVQVQNGDGPSGDPFSDGETVVVGVVPRGDKGDAGGITGGTLTGDIDADGNDILNSGNLLEQGKHTIGLPAAAWTARDTNGAESKTHEFATNDVNVTVFDFDSATEEAIQVAIPMPVSSDESAGLTAIIGWTETNGNSGDVVWGVSALALGDDDAIDSALGTEVTVTDTVTAQGDLMQTAETSTITPAGTWAAGDLVLVQLARKAANGSDTLGGDARMVNVRLFYTINAATDA
jgi:hypothetical protein